MGEPPQACRSQRGSDTRAEVAGDVPKAPQPGTMHPGDLTWAPNDPGGADIASSIFQMRELKGGRGDLLIPYLLLLPLLRELGLLPGSSDTHQTSVPGNGTSSFSHGTMIFVCV